MNIKNKGKTLEEIYGKKRAKEIKNKYTNINTNKPPTIMNTKIWKPFNCPTKI